MQLPKVDDKSSDTESTLITWRVEHMWRKISQDLWAGKLEETKYEEFEQAYKVYPIILSKIVPSIDKYKESSVMRYMIFIGRRFFLPNWACVARQ